MKQTLLNAGNSEHPAVLIHVTTVCLVEAWAVKIRPVRTISRKGPVPLTGWIESHMTWATGSPDSSMEREASTSLSVESVIVDCHGASRCRSTCRRSGEEAPELLRSVFGVGTVRGRSDGVFYFEVTKPTDLKQRVFPFFDRFELRSPKRNDLAVFRTITELVLSGRHLSAAGIEQALGLRAPMNRGGKRRRSDDEIIATLRDWESSEAICRAPSMKQRDEDMVHTSWRHGD